MNWWEFGRSGKIRVNICCGAFELEDCLNSQDHKTIVHVENLGIVQRSTPEKGLEHRIFWAVYSV